jgi:hypothetical protein
VAICVIGIVMIPCYLLIYYNQSHPQAAAQTFNGIVDSLDVTTTRGHSHYHVNLLINNNVVKLSNQQLYDDVRVGDKIKFTVQKGYFGWYYAEQLEDDKGMYPLVNL